MEYRTSHLCGNDEASAVQSTEWSQRTISSRYQAWSMKHQDIFSSFFSNWHNRSIHIGNQIQLGVLLTAFFSIRNGTYRAQYDYIEIKHWVSIKISRDFGSQQQNTWTSRWTHWIKTFADWIELLRLHCVVFFINSKLAGFITTWNVQRTWNVGILKHHDFHNLIF